MSAFNTLFAANENKQVSVIDKVTGLPKFFRVNKLSDKTGTMKNGEKAAYVVLTAEDGTSTVINLHPQAASALFKKGKEAGMEITEAAPQGWDKIEGGEEVNEQPAAVQADSAPVETVTETAEEVNGEGDVLLNALITGKPVDQITEVAGETVIDVAAVVVPEDAAKVNEVLAIEPETVVSSTSTALILHPTQAVVDVEVKEVNGAAEPDQKATESVDKKVSKKDQTIAIVHAGWKAGLQRKDIIAQLRTELNMGVPGANTYYQNVKSGAWGGIKG